MDAEEGNGGPDFLAPRDIPDAILAFRDNALVSGLTLREAVALQVSSEGGISIVIDHGAAVEAILFVDDRMKVYSLTL